MKKLFFALLILSTGLQGCELHFINNTPHVVLLSLDERLGDNLPATEGIHANAKHNNPKVFRLDQRESKKSKPDEDRNWYFYILENQVFVKRYKLSMHACMSKADDAAKTIRLSDLFAKKVDGTYLKVTNE